MSIESPCASKAKTIILINHYAGSNDMGFEFRPYYMAREWIKSGCKVVIISGDYSHLRKNNPIVKTNFQEDIIDGITYCWVKSGVYSGNGAKRALSMFRFVGQIFLHARLLVNQYHPDVVISSSTYPLDTYAAQRIARIGKAKLIHEVHDMWPITPIELNGMSPKHPFIVLMQMAENSFCKKSDAVVSVLPCAQEYLTQHGMKKEKFNYIPNGIVMEDWTTPEELPLLHKDAIEKAHSENRFIIAFFGSHTKSYNLDTLIYAAEKCDQKRFFLLFVGEGNYKQELIKLAEGLEPDTATFLPSVPKKAIPNLLSSIDASYVGAAKNRMFRFGIGMNKLFDAMMGGKPVLYAVDAPNNLVKDYDCGICVESENIAALADGINDMLRLSENTRSKMGANGRDAIFKHYAYNNVANEFLKVMEAL